ncbi:BREX-2 system adenine-specific DNA-methyltransferase PglX [Kitasatospora sp. RB6PN24]|uniref:BREX-2 system adenine-specific DNA-methyltransferase PglX n=1 Tax=Kitasatospora humi TaxID=2893891 RepID=UPI001E469D46|nr:BREX-2 system adenine-specific DNA-methyltransferase PglX [Kitasatospora humi]MCC9307579.1 BREX-2 system adenine-specific DNA-methyltransferase PglX [Kitasatospora humi]
MEAGQGAGTEPEPGTGVDKAGLLRDLRRQVTALEDDLRERSASEEEFDTRLRREYQQARDAKRTAATYEAWREDRITQAAVAWVLACVFVRFCEDNGLIDVPFLAGPGERQAEAEERHEAFFREHPHLNNRDWLIESFRYLAGTNGTVAGLFDERHNPLWELTPSYEAATELLRFWRRWGSDGHIQYDFTDPTLSTRFLGDLYQDLSDHARKTYALLQTPEFVEEFILDLTLEPAIEEFGLDPVWAYPEGTERRGLRTIDPACGSGHFLLGIFERLVAKWRAAEPGTDRWTIVRRALESVHGCDKNPFAANIARFRLLVAAMRAAGTKRLKDAPAFPINVAVGDSLLHGRGAAGVQTDLGTLFAELEAEEEGTFVYATEDVAEYAARVDLLGRGSYHVVVGNPPYITPKDSQENENYRDSYLETCSGKYALSIPFAQRIFELAIRGTGGTAGGGGFSGQITANSFMKREFGKKIIERFFHGIVELSHVIDTSGAYIPGHGTPTVILLGRNRNPRQERTIRTVLGVRGEPSQPNDAASGLVWKAITNQVRTPGSSSDWVSVEDTPASKFSTHPWSVSGGGAGDLFEALEKKSTQRIKSRAFRIGVFGVLGSDDAMTAPHRVFAAKQVEENFLRALTTGDEVRNWASSAALFVTFPYDSHRGLVEMPSMSALARHMWPMRTELGNRATFAKRTYFAEGRPWHEWHQLPKDIGASDKTLTFAFVATHNHFVLDRGGKVFNRSAPVIKLPGEASEDEHLELLGVLNSSTACFWLKQVSQGKGGSGLGRGLQDEEWEERYEFTGTKLQEFPLPQQLPLELARTLDALAQELAQAEPSAVCATGAPSRSVLTEAHTSHTLTRQRLIALQEELDWQVYGLYGLLRDHETARVTASSPKPESIPEVRLGERAFEIVLARKVASGETETAWFERHGSTPITEVPTHWPDWYREIVQARIDTIENRRDIALIERPECKRRWSSEPWEKKEKAALRTWLLDHCESRDLWFTLADGMEQPRLLTVNQLADALHNDTDVNAVAQLYATDHLGKPDLPLADVLAEITTDEHVPYLAAMRYKDTGLRIRAQWEEVWEKQREEDRTGERLDIPVPPKYKASDFLKPSYWSHRGKLDVPKERFVSYLGASPDADPTTLLGWAGWDDKEQAQALINLIEDRTEQAAWGTERITPLLAGLRELMPWVRQWHGEYDPEWESVPADDCEAYLSDQIAKHQLSADDLTAWRPERKTRGRKPATAKKPKAEQPTLDEG